MSLSKTKYNICKWLQNIYGSSTFSSRLKIIFVFVSPYDTDDQEFGQHLVKHGDGVKDVAFEVEDLDAIVKIARARGANIVKDVYEETDAFGTARFAVLKTVSFLCEIILRFISLNLSVKRNAPEALRLSHVYMKNF